MRDEGLFLEDIVEAIDDMTEFVAECDEEHFLQSKLVQSAVLRKLMIVGEAASRLSSELRARHPEIDWPKIIGFRNVAAHAYFGIDWHVVWESIILNAPILREKVSDIPFWEFPETQTDN